MKLVYSDIKLEVMVVNVGVRHLHTVIILVYGFEYTFKQPVDLSMFFLTNTPET